MPRKMLVTVLGGALALTLGPWVGSASAKTPLRWILTGSNMNKLRTLEPAVADWHFNTARAMATGNEFGDQTQVPSGYGALATLKYESFAKFKSDVSAGRIDPTVKVVVYDPENWADTPEQERKDPGRYLAMFRDLAKSRGYVYGAAPSRDIVTVSGGLCTRRSGERISDAFLRCRIAEKAAACSSTGVCPDIYQAQSQVHESDPPMFRWFLEQTRAQARAVNGNVTFMGGISTSPYRTVATAEMLYTAHLAVKTLVQGYYFTVNGGEEDVARAFLARLRQDDLSAGL